MQAWLPGWVVKTVNGMDVTGVPFEAIMESLDDEVLDPVAALSLNLKESKPWPHWRSTIGYQTFGPTFPSVRNSLVFVLYDLLKADEQ